MRHYTQSLPTGLYAIGYYSSNCHHNYMNLMLHGEFLHGTAVAELSQTFLSIEFSAPAAGHL